MPYKKKKRTLFGSKKDIHQPKSIKITKEEPVKPIQETAPIIAIKDEKKKVTTGKQSKSKPMSKRKKLMMAGITSLSILIAASVFFCIFSVVKEQKVKQAAALDALPRIVVPAGYFTPVSYEYTFLKSMKAIKLTPKIDLYANIAQTQADLEKEVDAILADIKTLEFNSLIIDTKYDDKVIFASQSLESTPIDLLSIVIAKAKAQNISVVAVVHANGLKKATGELMESNLAYENKEALFESAAELARNYELDSILIDDYYVKKDASSYAEFKNYGGIGDYEQWLTANTYATVEGISQSIKSAKNSLATGLVVDSVWDNKANNENGSDTKAEFTALKNGFADTRTMVQDKIVDFVNVRITTSTENPTVNFKTAATWWGNLCKEENIPMYITHSGENLNSKELVGWTGFDELTLQVSDALKKPSYSGSAFTGLKNMIADMEKGTKVLLLYLKNQYSENDLQKKLSISLPTKQQFVTYEEEVQFRGEFDPNQEVILNGKKVTPSKRGGFSVWVPLTIGKNTITLEHKGRTTTYNIERNIDILKSVKPTKAMTVPGGSQIEFNVMAYKGSKITATINGKTITLTQGGAGEDNAIDTSYENYQATYTVPAAKNKTQNIGKVTFKGAAYGYTEFDYSGTITIDKIPDEVDPDTATGQVFTHAVVDLKYANTYPYLTTPGYPQSILYQLPYGTQDIVQSISGDFVNLRSGKTVKKGAVTLTDIPFVGNNAITAMSAGLEGNDTVLRATFNWKAPFSLTPYPYPTEPEQTRNYSFGSDKVILLFDYTTYIDKNAIASTVSQIATSPLFSGATFERVFNQNLGIHQYKATLTLSKAGSYYGCHAEYEGNTLVLRFNNPNPGTLSGLTIALDPGHGGNDNGTMAGSDCVEKTVNLIMGEKVKAELEALGANVIMTRYDDSNPSLDQRVLVAHNNRADMLISLHHNSAGSNSSPSGVETYFNAPFSQPLANYVQQQLGVYLNNRGAKPSVPNYNFILTREKQFPSILIEYGFLSNPSDEAMALDPTHQDNMARATAQGVLDYYNALG